MSVILTGLVFTILRAIRDAFLVLMISTCLAQVTKRTPHSWYYFFFIVILVGLSFNIY